MKLAKNALSKVIFSKQKNQRREGSNKKVDRWKTYIKDDESRLNGANNRYGSEINFSL